MEASNLPNIKFKLVVISMLNSMKKDIETIKKDQLKINNVILFYEEYTETNKVIVDRDVFNAILLFIKM